MKHTSLVSRVSSRAAGHIALLLVLAGTAPRVAAQTDPNQGPGGPILVITSATSTYGKYYAEILRTEGLNEFSVMDIGAVTQPVLSAYDVAILAGPTALTTGQVSLLSDWVNLGGNLIAMRPDPQLSGLLGITPTGSTMSNAYPVIDTSTSPGNGIVSQPVQFHGTAALFTLSGASKVATLYTSPTNATINPAVTLRAVGTNGGHAAAFAYDLATSIVYTRQGNPAWAAQERDGFMPIRSDDKFFGGATGDPQPDWVDLDNVVSIPQADEQQRLLANLILVMNLGKKPLPRFWYFPNRKKAVVVMTGDDHGNGGTTGRFDQQLSQSPPGCSVANWECVRSTSYMFVQPGNVSDAQAASYTAQGFEVGLHINTDCADFTPTSLESTYSQQVAAFRSAYPSIPAPATQRHHCIAWSDWITGAQKQLNYGMRFDASYYFWPPGWAQNRPGHFTGSAMAMRFADLDGTIVNVYNAATQMTDESGQTYPFTIDTLLDAAVGPQGFYGVYTVNSHTDTPTNPVSDAVVPSALARGVPVVSSVQMLRWLDARNTSSFSALNWAGNVLTFNVNPGTGAIGLYAMIPTRSAAGILTSITGPSGATAFTVDTIKGIDYAFVQAAAGTYTATYAADTTSPNVTSTAPLNGATGITQTTAVSAVFSEAMDPSTINTSTVLLQDPANASVSGSVAYNPATRTATLTPSTILAPGTLYRATITTGVKDLSNNALATAYTWSFTTAAGPSCPCSIWSSANTPAEPSVADPNPVELGVKFRTDLNGSITGLRFYKGAANTGTHTGNLWTTTGQLLATATFINETSSGWQQVNFSSPVPVTANTVYVASYHTTSGNYAANGGQFAAAGVDNAPLHLLRDGVSGGNGVYAYGASSSFPTSTWQSTNYWVDVVFTTTGGPGPGPLNVISTAPAPAATGVTTGTAVSATFNNTPNATTVNASTFTVRHSVNNTLVTGTYSVSGTTATLTPSSPLAASTTYNATLTTGIADSTGSALAAPYTWSFTTAGTTAPTGPEPAGWFSGDIHVHRSCGGPPDALSSILTRMDPQNLAVISLLADSGVGEVQNAVTDLPLVNGLDASISTPGRIVHWDTEWHWDPTFTTAAHQALGGHIVNLGLTRAQQLWDEYTFKIIDWTHQNGGIAGFAHMQYLDGNLPQSLTCCTPIEYPVEVALGSADFISEDVDDNGSPFSMQPEAFIQAYYRLLNTGFRPGFAAGTDYPCNGSRDLGSLLTYVQVASGTMTYRNWIDGIKNGRTVVSRNGHREFLDLKVNTTSGPGDEIRLTAGASLPVTVQWTSTQNLSGTIELVSNGVVVATRTATVTPGTADTWSTTVNFPKSGWIAARRMGADGHQVHTAAVFVIVNNAPIRASATDAQFFIQWMDNLLAKTSPGGPWNSYLPTKLAEAQARYQAAKTVFQQRANEATGPTPLSVTTTTPATGATGVSAVTTVSVIFNNALNAATVTSSTFILRDAANTVVSASVTVSGNTATLTPSVPLTASAIYSATLTTAITDVNGSSLAATYSWSFTVSASTGPACTSNCTIWPASTIPGRIDGGADSPVELGVKFRSDVNGTVTGIRFYKASTNTGTHVGSLWSTTGQRLAFATFTETASGWQQVNFTTPVSITANTVYIASYHTTVGHYGDDLNYFATSGVDNPPLHALRNGESGSNSVYAYGPAGTFPTQTFSATNYWVDVVFTPATTATLNSIAVTPAAPAIPAGGTQPFTATGTYSDSSTQNITNQVTWSSSNTGIATISAAGIASGVTAGTTTITAVLGSVSGNTTLTVQPAPPSVSTTSLSGGTVGVAYSATLAATGGTPPYAWTITAGSLPAGLTLTGSTGNISGNPTTAGTSTFTVQVTDSASPGASGSKSLSITIAPALASIAVTPTTATIQTGGTQQFTATGTYSNGSTQNITNQVTWTSTNTAAASITAAGLASGVAAGTTTITATLGTITGSATMTVLAPPTITTTSLSGGTVGVAYSAPLAASGGTPPYTWGLASGTLPAGLILDASTGTIAGTPTAAGTSTFTVRVTDSSVPAGSGTRSLSIAVSRPIQSTLFLAPTANAPVITSAGDNNGFQTTPANAYVVDGLYAVDPNSGSTTSTSCTNSGKDKHIYSTYGISLPAGVAIRGIEVRLDALADSTANTPAMCVQLSWNGGSSWTTARTTPTLTTSLTTYILGGTTDTWGRSWTLTNLSNANFRIRIANVASSVNRTFSLDSVALRITYQ